MNTVVINKWKHIKKVLFYVLAILEIFIAIFICLYKLDVMNIADFDEARHGINAYEMIKNNNFIVNTYCYQPDYWNLKPPLSYWSIILCYKIFGYNTVGLRAYSGVSFLLMYAVVIIFMKKRFGRTTSLVCGWFILSLYILTDGHLTRYGDADSLYCLLYVGAFVSLLSSDKNKKMFAVSGLCFSLAFLTKSYHAATILISTLIYLLINKRYKTYSKRDYLIYFLAASLPILLWMIFRFSQDGFRFFIESVYTDILSRSTKDMVKYKSSFYYLSNIFHCFKILLLVTSISFILSIICRKKIKFDGVTSSLLIWISIPILLFSIVKGKLAWYVYPEYFMLCMLLAAIFSEVFKVKNKLVFASSVILLLLPARYVLANVTNVLNSEQYTNKEQYLIFRNINRTDKYAGKKFYEPNGHQSTCLLVELYGDMLYTEGGIDDFADETSNAYLFISNEEYLQNYEKLKDMKIIDKNTDNLLLTKE